MSKSKDGEKITLLSKRKIIFVHYPPFFPKDETSIKKYEYITELSTLQLGIKERHCSYLDISNHPKYREGWVTESSAQRQ